jgi:hypothetical protein
MPWFPPCEGADTLLERGIRRTLSAWAGRWLPEASAIEPFEIAVDMCSQGRGSKARCELDITADLCLRLGELAAGMTADPSLPADAEVLESVGRAALEDLRTAFDAHPEARVADPSALEVKASMPVLPGLTFTLDGGLVPGLRELGVNPSSSVPSLGTLADALAAEPIMVRCALGEAEIAAGDVVGLTPGDLLVLDSRVTDAVPMVAAPGSPPLGHCHLAAEGDAIILKLAGTPPTVLSAGGA